MQDFIRIGGPIVSSPLNENFRRLLNAISMANVNLVFPEEDGVVSTVEDMYAVPDPLDGQVCYVVSSGEFYRYSKTDNQWHKIMDIGQTFRQGFLNSGAVVLEGPMVLKEGTNTTISIPAMLVYFKNKEGDGRYLKGMYKIEATDLDVGPYIDGSNAFSIFVDYTGTYSVTTGLPSTDDVNHIFIGTFLVDADAHVMEDSIYTLPDIAYTADRGNFLLNGGQASGMNLTPGEDGGTTVNRVQGYYYDEGINYSTGQTSDFPADTDNGSNFDLKHFDGETPVTELIYIIPRDGLNNTIVRSEGLIYNKYYNLAMSELEDVPEGYFTVQQHLVSPNGQNFMIYGTELYNSITDAVSNINSTYGVDVEFPYVEATRVVLGKPTGSDFNSNDTESCRFYTTGRLSQVGTISPEFADNVFRIYSGDAQDVTPSSIRFDLADLQSENYNSLYTMGVLPSHVTRQLFAIPKKYIIDGNTQTVSTTSEAIRTTGSATGYMMADNDDIGIIINRLNAIETEIWNPYQNNKQRYEQSIRYRLFNAETRLDDIDTQLEDHETRITWNEQNKVYKGTTINGYRLGDTTSKNEAKAVVLKTGDIDEGTGQGSTTNLWFTQARVSQNTDVITAKNHVNTISASGSASGHTVVNPHNLSTDDIKLLTGTTKVFVTPEEERRIRSDRLPENTISELNKKLEDINIQTIGGSSANPGSTTNLGDVTALKFYTFGANVDVDTANKVATIECVGQTDPSLYLLRSEFAVNATARPDLYAGAVDRALNADNVTALDNATADQYYGTNSNGDKGVFDLPIWVSTMDASGYTSVDQATFVPIDESITLKHLANGKVVYPASYEETTLGTNVYDLVKYHYHKVYNSGSQGPYISGTTTQDTSAIKYQYTVPAGGLTAHVYYFTYNNSSYKFTATTAMVANTLLTYTPSINTLKYKLPSSSTETSLTITAVAGSAVENDYWLPFVAKTDWNKINEWNFGDNLTVTVTDGRATINANVAGSGASSFANLSDTDVIYNESNVGKMIALGKDGSNNYKLQFMAAPLNNYMLISDYVDSTVDKRVKYAARADSADVALTANKLQNTYTVNDSGTSNQVLWTASKIKSNTTAQIKAEGVNTYYGTSAPTTVSGSKDGDLYILIEN